MFRYRTTGSHVESVHVKPSQPFRWLRRLFRRLKFKHARFDDGKYTRECKDIEKWREGCAITDADYPDHRWQAITKSCRQRLGRGRSTKDDTSEDKHHPSFDAIQLSPTRAPACRPRDIIVHRRYEERMARKRYSSLRNATAPGRSMETGEGSVPGGLTSPVEDDLHYGTYPWRPEKLVKPQDKVRVTLRQVEAGVREQLSGYVPLDQGRSDFKDDVSTPPAASQGSKRRSPIRYTIFSLPDSPSVSPVNTHVKPVNDKTHSNKVCDRNTYDANSIITDIFSEMDNKNEVEHEKDNDANHLRLVESVRPTNKKPKGRKSKRRKARRKGKYKELVAAPSSEVLEEEREDSLEPGTDVQQRAKRKILKLKKERKTVGRRMRELEAGLKTLRFEAPIPILHVFTHRRHYTRLH